MVFSIEVLIEQSCQASRALEAKINTKCAVELPALWGPEIDAFVIEVLTEMDRRASRALEVRNLYFSQYNFEHKLAVELPELWRPEIDGFLNRSLNRTELLSL